MRGVTGLCRRVYHDYLRPDQTTGYEDLLRMAVENGYVFETVSSFDQRVREGGVQPQSRYCILRRDVDTKALSTLRRMLQAEVKYGARCAYFFRDITLDIPLVKQITAAGGEVSYHYEEMSAYAFAHRIRDAEKLRAAMQRGEPVLYLLTHPRQWGADFRANAREDFLRLYHGIAMRQ